MKTIVYFLILTVLNLNINGFVIQGQTQENNRFTPDAALNHIVEVIRRVIKNGDPALGLPILDPFRFNLDDFSHLGEIFSANVSISNGILTGLSDFQVQELSFSNSELFIGINLRIPLMELNAEYYESKGAIFDAVPIRGRGVMYIKVDNWTLWGKLYLKQSEDGRSILLSKTENAGFHIDQIVSHTEFDNNIDDILSAMAEDLLAGYLNRFNGYITAKFNEQLIERLNPILEQFDSWQLIDAISSLS